MIYSTHFYNGDYNAEGEEWYQHIKDADGVPVLFNGQVPFLKSRDSGSFITIGQVIMSPDGLEPIGVALINYHISLIRNMCLGLKYNEDSNIILVDNSGKIVIETNEKDIGNNEATIEKLRGQNEGYFIENQNGDKRIIMYESIEPYDWKIISIFSQKQIELKIKQYLSNINLYIFILLYVFVFVTLVNFNRQLKPLNKIAIMMKESVSNNFSARVNLPSTIREVEMLSNSFNFMTGKIRELIEKEYVAKIKQQQAEISALEAQINPHFLYNTLETIRWSAVKNGNEEIGRMIYSLSGSLRYSITDMGEKVKVSDEINWLKNYIYIQKIRFKNLFDLRLEIDDEILDCKIHKLVLQPFVENSIVHGFKDYTSGGLIIIKGYLEENILNFEINDNGAGFSKGNIEVIIDSKNVENMEYMGIGICNAVKRLALYYGQGFQVSIVSRRNKGTSIGIRIELTEENKNVQSYSFR